MFYFDDNFCFTFHFIYSFCLKLKYRSFISLCGQRNEPKKTTRGYAPFTPTPYSIYYKLFASSLLKKFEPIYSFRCSLCPVRGANANGGASCAAIDRPDVKFKTVHTIILFHITKIKIYRKLKTNINIFLIFALIIFLCSQSHPGHLRPQVRGRVRLNARTAFQRTTKSSEVANFFNRLNDNG